MNGFMRTCLRGRIILPIVCINLTSIAIGVAGEAGPATSRPAGGNFPPDLLEPLEIRPVFATSQPTSAPSTVPINASLPASPAVPASPDVPLHPAATQPALVVAAPALPPADPLEVLQERLEQIADDLSAITVCIRATPGPDGRGTSMPSGEGPTFGGGIVLSSDGLILTCEHVVRGALAVDVTLSDGRQFRARVLGVDVRADVALMRVSASGLTAAELCDAARLRRGRLVLAAGYPPELAAGHQPAVSQGMVCAVGRPLPGAVGAADDRYYGDMIQFTAPISGGFSGGPLVDLRGRVVGLVTASESGGGGVFGFAMPVGSRLRRLIDQLSTGDAVRYGWLGVAAADLDEAQARLLGLPGASGARLHLVEHAGPADRAGLAEDDVVVALNGAAVADADSLIARAGDLPPGTMTTVDYIRAGHKMRTRVLVDRRAVSAPVAPPAVPVEFRGATLAAIGESLRKAANLPGNAMIVTLVRGDTPADRAGLAPGDVVVRIQGSPPSVQAVAGLADEEGDVLVGKASGGSVLVKGR